MPPAQAQSYQYHTSAAAAATSGTGRSLPVPGAHMQYGADEWQRPPNAANMQHAVDFRRSWVPSPEMRDLFPLPPSGERYPVLQPQTYMAATQTHAHPQRPAMPPTARARRAEGGRALHRQSQSYSLPSGAFAGDELSSYARTRPRAATVTGAGTRTEMGMGNGSALGMANGAANGMANGMANGTAMSMVNGRNNGMANGSPMRMVNGSAMGMVNGSAMGMVNGSASGSARHLLHTTSTGGPREQAPEARQVWRSVHESQVQRELHAGGRGQEPVPEPVPERAGDLRRTANRRRNVNGAGSGRPKSWLSLFHPKRLFSTRRSRTDEEEEDPAEAAWSQYENLANWPYSAAREVTPAQWRAYGAWARPYIDRPWGMVVHNATPPDHPRELSPSQVNAMLATLRDPDGTLHPGRWAPRTQHPSLPPRPDLWPTPQLDEPELPPEALQLNPFLQHKIVGRPPLHFDLRYRTEDITMQGDRAPAAGPNASTSAGPSTSATAPEYPNLYVPRARRHDPRPFTDCFVDGPNGAQPATYPGVPSLKITALAGDPRHEFPWPLTVFAHHERLPVQVADVLNALIANFEERMFHHEVEELSEDRSVMVRQAYWRRMRLPVGGVTPPEDDGLRRVDYLGDATYFRGLAPAGDGEGFMLFLGPPP